MARMRRKLVAGMALLGLSGLTPAAAESVPLPKPAPQSKEGTTAPIAPRPVASAQPQNPVADLANGLKSLFNLDRRPSFCRLQPAPRRSLRRSAPRSTK